jgi:RNA polymerase sigma factor (sigma-70 family)
MRDPSRLVAAARNGDREALSTLLVAHRAQVLGTCARMLGDPLLAEEAYQEASLAVLLNLDLLRQPERFGAWFTGIALNVCRRALRERRRAPLPAAGADAGRDVEDQAIAALEAAGVREAVAGLPAGQREAVLLFYVEGLTQAEVGAQLGIPAGAVKTRLHRARAALRERLSTFREAPAMTGSTTDTHEYVEMTVRDVRRFQRDGRAHHVLVLADAAGGHHLPAWIGPAEASFIALRLEQVETPRPMTAALAANLVAAADARIREVRVERLEDEVFYAVVVVDGPAGRREVDARPSDAICLALLSGCPIRVRADVLEASERRRSDSDPLQAGDSAGVSEISADAMQHMRPAWPGRPE